MGSLHVVWELLRKLSTSLLSHQRPHKSPQEKGVRAEGSLPWHCLQKGQGERWSPTTPLGLLYPVPLQNHPHTQLHTATEHCQGQARPGIQQVRNTVPIVMLPAWPQRPKTTGHHPKPSACCLPARRKPCTGQMGEKKATFCSGNVNLPSCPLGSALHSGFPRDLASLPPGTRLHSPKNKSST